jgi:hypothetical protein
VTYYYQSNILSSFYGNNWKLSFLLVSVASFNKPTITIGSFYLCLQCLRRNKEIKCLRRDKERLMFLENQNTLLMSIGAMLQQKIRGLLLLFAVSKCTKTDPFGIVKENYYPTSFNRRISPIQEFNQILVGSRILVLWVRKSSSFLEKKWKCISRVITMFFWRGRMF